MKIGRKVVLRSPWAAALISASGFVALVLGITYLFVPDAGVQLSG